MNNLFYNLGYYQTYIILGLIFTIFIALIILIITIIISLLKIRSQAKESAYKNQNVEEILSSLIPGLEVDKKNIQKIADQINQEKQGNSFNQFEREQEEKAIISYQELVNNISHQTQELADVVKVELPERPAAVNPVTEISKDLNIKPPAIASAKDYLQDLKDLKNNLK